LSQELSAWLQAARAAACSESCAQRLSEHLLSVLLCPEKSTLTNLICTSGHQQQDWSAHYRLYSQDRVDEGVLFDLVRTALLSHLKADEPLVVALDDTLLRKSGTHIDGVAWRRDPLGPSFQTNLVRAQRFIQFSAAWPLADGESRMVPIGFFHAPSAPKAPKDADSEKLKVHREEHKQLKLNSHALQQIKRLRQQVEPSRTLIFNGDGSYTNKDVVKKLPVNTVYIGRIRKDASLHALPLAQGGPSTGRPLRYGAPAPTPEQLRTDESKPWQPLNAFAAGKQHQFRIKALSPLLWRKSGAELPLKLMVIAPLGYKLRKGSRLLYRQPAFIICTDPTLPLDKILQYYLWRWGIEVNFREEKHLIGVGEAHVRTPSSNRHLPAVVVAAYALLWISTLGLVNKGLEPGSLTPPKWRRASPKQRSLPSTGDLLRNLRFELWAGALRPSTFYHFATSSLQAAKSQKPPPSPAGVLFASA
jgi:DDE superfamily endonuclease